LEDPYFKFSSDEEATGTEGFSLKSRGKRVSFSGGVAK
jgi:hypothetical protein